MRLDVEAARRAIEERVARPMGLELTDAAWGIHRVVNENMAGGRARPRHRARQGPARLSALRLRRRGPGARLAGGAHPESAARARAVRGGRALGLRAPGRAARLRLRAHRAAAHGRRGLGADQPASSTRWKRKAAASSAAPAWPTGTSRVRRTAEMRYLGQGHEVDVEIPAGPLGSGSLDAITAAFEAAYRALYSRTPQGVPLEALNWRAVVSGPRPDLTITGGDGGRRGGRAGSQEAPRRPTSRRRAATSRPRCTTATRSAPGARLAARPSSRSASPPPSSARARCHGGRRT